MIDLPDRFQVIEGGAEPRRDRRDHPDGHEVLTCPTCEWETGLETSMFIEAAVAPMTCKQRVVVQSKTLICVYCLMRGKITPVTP